VAGVSTNKVGGCFIEGFDQRTNSSLLRRQSMTWPSPMSLLRGAKVDKT